MAPRRVPGGSSWIPRPGFGRLRAAEYRGEQRVVLGVMQSSGWKQRIAVLDPFEPTRTACVVEHTGAVATSGTYERGQHLFDPFSRRAASVVASATVTGPELGLADALATALAVGGQDVLDRIGALHGFEALTIGHDGEHRATSGFPSTPVPVPDPAGPHVSGDRGG